MHSNTGILIIGAGASGLLAARQLSRAGLKVAVLEARNRIGGRIHTIDNDDLIIPVEAGAEFIHGNLKITQQLLKEYEISLHAMHGSWYQYRNGNFKQENNIIEHHRLLEKHLKEIKDDISVEQFLETHFPGDECESFRNSIKGFVEGYDAADASRASTLAFRDEWLNDDNEQYRISGGYGNLINAIADDCKSHGCEIHLNSMVTSINWREGYAEITCDDGSIYTAGKIIITVPIGVLQSGQNTKGVIIFTPALTEKLTAARLMGFGSVIKIVLQFDEAFWRNKSAEERTGKNLEDLGWILSDKKIPTWWTQLPEPLPRLTGWLAGPKANKMKDADDTEILNEAIGALADIFKMSSDELSAKLKAMYITNWGADPFSRGGYSYITLETEKARKIMNEPVMNTLFFAGEALHTSESGTVEAAFESGLQVAEKILLFE